MDPSKPSPGALVNFSQWGVSRVQKKNSSKIIGVVLRPSQYQNVNWSLGCILGHFEANQSICFFLLQKMAFCVKPFLAIFALFLLTMAPFGPRTSRTYLLHPFRCKKASRITKNEIKSLFEILGASETLKATRGQK